jgi:hypothetical protein
VLAVNIDAIPESSSIHLIGLHQSHRLPVMIWYLALLSIMLHRILTEDISSLSFVTNGINPNI